LSQLGLQFLSCYNSKEAVFITDVTFLVPGLFRWQLVEEQAAEAGNRPEHMNCCLWPAEKRVCSN